MKEASLIWGIAALLALMIVYTIWVVGYAQGGFVLYKTEKNVERVTLPTQEIRTTVPVVEQTVYNITNIIQRPVPVEKIGDCLIINGDNSKVYCDA